MLVLTRKLGEKIVLGDGIVVTVVAIKGGQVRLGIDAPQEVPVMRGELLADRPTIIERSGPVVARPTEHEMVFA
jgi:carbon storage regulator